MKKPTLSLLLCSFFVAASAHSDGIGVTNSCSLGNGTLGLAVCVDGTSVAYVQKVISPDAPSITSEFLIDPRSISLNPGERTMILHAFGPTPSPGTGACSNAIFSTSFQLSLSKTNTGPDVLYLLGRVAGDLCGLKGGPAIPIAADDASRVCLEWASEQFRFEPGFLRIAVVPADQSCPTDLCSCNEFATTISNPKVRTSFMRFGTPQTNPTNPSPNPPTDRFCLDDISFDWPGGSFLDDFQSGGTSNWDSSVPGSGCI